MTVESNGSEPGNKALNPNDRKLSKEWSTPGLVAAFGGVGILSLVISICSFAALDVGRWQFWKEYASINWFDTTRAAVTLCAALGVGIGIALAYRRQVLGENQLEHARALQNDERTRDRRDHRTEVIARRRDRFTAVTVQLANEAVTVRIAGVYSLAALADEWLEDVPAEEPKPELHASHREAQVCIDVLCAYIRTNSDKPSDSESAPWDIEVRQTIIGVIGGNFRASSKNTDVARPGPWSRLNLDFTNAVFNGDFDLIGIAPLGEVTFRRARFAGGTFNFSRTRIQSGARFVFSRASFLGAQVEFDETYLYGTAFNGATFNGGSVSFSKSTFPSGTTSFKNANFNGALVAFFDISVHTRGLVDFGDIRMNSGNLFFLARPSDESGKRMHGGIIFDESRFSGGTTHIDAPLEESKSGFFSFKKITGSAESLPQSAHWDASSIPEIWPARTEKI